jgi:hypothetical protein
MGEPAVVSESTVRTLAALGDLPLAPGREAVIAPPLNVWIGWANELNRKMSAAEHWTLTPITTFSHPPDTGGE